MVSSQSIVDDVGYTLFAIAIVATIGRFYIRWRWSALVWDDFFNGLALACLIAYYIVDSRDSSLYATTTFELQLSMAESLLLWIILYLVKASFLALSWAIFKVSASFRKAWWIVTIYTFLTFWPVTVNQFWQCGPPSAYNDPVACSNYDNPNEFIALSAMCAALHGSSELLILALPLIFIRKLHMSKAQKISAGGVFAIAIINITMGFMRNLGVMCFYLGFNEQGSNDMQYIMQLYEPTLAVVVCTLPAYKVVLPKLKKQRSASQGLRQEAQEIGIAAPREKSVQSSDMYDSVAELERVDMF